MGIRGIIKDKVQSYIDQDDFNHWIDWAFEQAFSATTATYNFDAEINKLVGQEILRKSYQQGKLNSEQSARYIFMIIQGGT